MDFLNAIPDALNYIRNHPLEVWGYAEGHLQLSLTAILIGIAVCFPLGVLASRSRFASISFTNVAGIGRSVPSVAILFLAYPLLGVGFRPTVTALTILACPPILINTNVAFREVDPGIREAAYGMGMTTLQVLGRIELPLALPVVIAGLRTASVEVIASCALGAFVGANCLGFYIDEGLSNFQGDLMMVGALSIAALTLFAELSLAGAERVARRVAGVPQ